ncbi:hypothetical protein ACE6H2_007362 [Prunus campanulata]
MAPIRIRNPFCYEIEDHRSPVQGLYEHGIFTTFFAGNEVPGLFSHKSTKSPISFTVPLLDNHRIQGLKVFVVYTNLYSNDSARDFPGPVVTRVRNKSKGLKWIYCPTFCGIPGEGEDVIWLSLWKLEEQVHLEGGDEVVVSVIMQPWIQVKEFGIQLMQLHENHNMMTVSTESSYYPCVMSGDLDQYQPGVYLLSRRRTPIQDPIWFNKILGDSDDEDTTGVLFINTFDFTPTFKFHLICLGFSVILLLHCQTKKTSNTMIKQLQPRQAATTLAASVAGR